MQCSPVRAARAVWPALATQVVRPARVVRLEWAEQELEAVSFLITLVNRAITLEMGQVANSLDARAIAATRALWCGAV